MLHSIDRRVSSLLGASAIALALVAGPSFAQSVFTATSDGFTGRVNASAAERGGVITPGGDAVLAGSGLIPGQEITLMRGTTVLNQDGPIVVGDDGEISFDLSIEDEAATGLQPIVVIAENPAAATVVEMKVSPDLPIEGADRFDITSQKVTRGLYQVALDDEGALYVTSAVGRPPVSQSLLVRVNPETLETEAEATPEAAPARPDGSDGGVFAVYGLDVDRTKARVWVTNTRQDTMAVYDAADLSLVKQFEPGIVPHSRDVVVDETRGRAYVSAAFTDQIHVFDTETLEQLEPITVPSQIRRESFSVMSLDLDEDSGTLFTVSMTTPEAAVIDLDSGEARIMSIPGAKSASGVAYDAQDGLLFVASQATDNLLIVDVESGEVLHDVETGAGALNVAFEPQSRLAYVANRGSHTIAVVDTDGQIVANIDAGTFPNHLKADGQGNVFAVNKALGEDDAEGDQIWRIRQK
ncbi:MAG: ATP-binding protein [Paracoccus sp. (in: a-proteobacteria)]|uniref:YncE family protein n=1 Tax=Paracoccus sp. TaxID=267 RepID=UPI0026DEEC6A|nr:ATP-binding protein [Paracoccus sp. (in: a-proteobacteria)]MDO5622756.1 ATP-binding protein [Paracoccus sp. (in: a-proteobacteria)]